MSTQPPSLLRRLSILSAHICPSLVRTHAALSALAQSLPVEELRGVPQDNGRRPGFPRTVVRARQFSREEEREFVTEKEVDGAEDLVAQPKGTPPPLDKVFGEGLPSGHVCIVGPTGSGKSTIVRGLLCALSANNTMSVYSMEYPVEVNLNTHGLFHVCQIDMFQQVQGKQRSLASTANMLLNHDPDIIYFGELRSKTDFEVATSTALSGVGVLSTGHAHSPMDLLERLRSMNIDLATQFRALRCIVGVQRVPILCPSCKQQVVLTGRASNRSLQLLSLYRTVSFPRHLRRQTPPLLAMPPAKPVPCPRCSGTGHSDVHTIYEYLYIFPNATLESLRQSHTHTTEETLISLIMQGSVNPLYLESKV